MKFEREIIFRPAYDQRDADPSKSYGIHGVDMTWYVKGGGQAVQFVVATNWHLKHVEEELDTKMDSRFPHLSCHPQPSDVGYHAKRPMYAGQSPMKNCHLTGGDCYYDGSILHADKAFQILVIEGGEAVWTYLEQLFWAQWPETVAASL